MTLPSTAEPTQSTTARPTDSKTYHSAVDWWLACLLIFPVVLAAGVGVSLMLMNRPSDASIMFLAAAGVCVVTMACCLPCRYTLLADQISIRCGLLYWQVPYADITSLQRSSTLASGPALSLRRVVIETAERRFIISPRHREQFMIDVRARLRLE
ncbi:MAG: PH domain-containing protein [Planctomycetota bacterium]